MPTTTPAAAASDPADDFSHSPPPSLRGSSIFRNLLKEHSFSSPKDHHTNDNNETQTQQHQPRDDDFSSFSQTAVLDPSSIAPPNNHDDNDNDGGDALPSPPATPSSPPPSAPPADNPTPDISKPYVTPQDFDLLRVIGMGAFGKVLQVRNRQTSTIHAMKVISKRRLRHKTSYIQNIHVERDILTKINHPFVVKMRCSFQTKEKLFIVMDFLAGGELFLRLGREGIFLEGTAMFYVAEIVLALEHLHSRGILHRDLKPENILLGVDGHLVLTDFGLAKDFMWDGTSGGGDGEEEGEDKKALTVCGTIEYMAPEMVARKGYSKPADWWSLGCITYEMLAGRPPFESKKGAKDLFRKIMNDRVRMPDGATAAACELLKGLLRRDAISRFGAARGTMFKVGGVSQVKQLKFFAGLDWGRLERKEVEPPERLVLDGEDDLRHFYDEFINMKLPRSVKEISDVDFKPRRCESDLFRGFSFIGEDFVLPERSDTQKEHYWNNYDEDGESRSDCASSKYGDDDSIEGHKNSNEPNLQSLQPTPEVDETTIASGNNDPPKKKRVRKKKKKKKEEGKEEGGGVGGGVGNGNEQDGGGGSGSVSKESRIAQIMKSEVDRQLRVNQNENGAVGTDGTTTLQSNGVKATSTTTTTTSSTLSSANQHQSLPQTQPITSKPSNTPPSTKPPAWGSAAAAASTQQSPIPKKKNPPPPQPTWETVGAKPSNTKHERKTAPTQPKNTMTTTTTTTKSSLPQSIKSKPPQQWTSVSTSKAKKEPPTPPPLTWATVGKAKTQSQATSLSQNSTAAMTWSSSSSFSSNGRPTSNNAYYATGQQPPPPPATTQRGLLESQTTSPGGSWRDHKLSRNTSSGRRIGGNSVETTKKMSPQSLDQTELWPSLGGGGGKGKQGPSSTPNATTRNVAQGCWGLKKTQHGNT